METVLILPFWFEFAAVLTGGLSGAMSAVRARYDVFGCIVIACATGLGGGMVRDVLLQDYGIYAFQNPSLLLMCMIGAIIVFYFGRLATYLDPIVDLLDNLSVAMWAIIGAGKSLSAGLGIIPSIILGTITAIGGGIMRDVLMNKSPEAFKAGPLYGSAALFGCIAYCVMHEYNFFPNMAAAMCATLVLGIRYASLALGWRTHEPRDYSDAVTHAVKKPMQFIARKAHVPMGKVARDRKNSRLNRALAMGRRAYDRLSGRWMTLRESSEHTPAQDATAKAANRGAVAHREDVDSGAPVPETDCVHWDDAHPEADVRDGAAELAAVASRNRDETAPEQTAPEKTADDKMASDKAADDKTAHSKTADNTDRIILDRAQFDELHARQAAHREEAEKASGASDKSADKSAGKS